MNFSNAHYKNFSNAHYKNMNFKLWCCLLKLLADLSHLRLASSSTSTNYDGNIIKPGGQISYQPTDPRQRLLIESDSSSLPFVAFVFAGGVRSFVMPALHESIRHNLINSFCPPTTCIGDVFVRMSVDDNSHDGQGFNAVGKKSQGDAQMLSDALKGVTRLAHDSVKGKVIHEVVNIGSEDESRQMDAVTSNDLKQKIYRDLDPRRYSMYFNRWKAYEMMLKEERDSNKKYHWVVHARLDMAWGAPIKPFNAWSLDKMWVPDMWYADVPDTFALLSRQISDIYYLLAKRYGPEKVMCLGGPNFDVRTVQRPALEQRGYSEEQIKVALEQDCFKMFEQNSYLVTHEKDNISWTSAGTSEVYLKRKLEYYGISLDKKTLGFSTFFMVLSRMPIQFVCFFIGPFYFIPWVKDFQNTTNAVIMGCSTMENQLSFAFNSKHGPNCDVEHYRSKQPTVDEPRSTCLLDKKMTDWNFLPFRIRRKGDLCLTAESMSFPDFNSEVRPLRMKPCVDTTIVMSYNTDYTFDQLFHMLPLSPLSQRVITWDIRKGTACLTVSSHFAVIGTDGVKKKLLELQRCNDATDFMPQLFRIQLGSAATHPHSNSTSLQGDSASHSGNLNPFKISRNTSTIFDPLLPEKSVAWLKWEGDGGLYCVSSEHLSASARQSSTVKIVTLEGDREVASGIQGPLTVMDHCHKSGGVQQGAGPANKRPVKTAGFVLERTKIRSPTS